MSMKYLGESFDIHCGGIDLIFPHHENEIAQSECATGKAFVRYWVHPEFLVVEGEKMSKSLGNFFTLRDLLGQGHSPQAIRYLLLSVHYRKQLNFTMDGLRQAQSSIQRLEDFRQRMKELADGSDPCPEFAAQIRSAQTGFIEAMDDDLNISAGLGVIFDFIRSTYQIHDQGRISRGDARAAVDFIQEMDQVLGVMRQQPELLDEEIARRIEERQAARKRRDFAEADRIRDWLSNQGIQLEDTREGIRWKRIHKNDLTQN
jgi:cysteinyl-tRNA synthetase